MSKFCQTDTRSRDDYTKFMENIQPCAIHGDRRIEFVCLNRQCEDNLMLCVQCIVDHRDHDFQKIEKFLSQEKYERIKQGQGRKHQHFDDMAELVKTKMDQIQKTIIGKLQEIKHRIDFSMERFKNLGIKMSDLNQKVDQHMMLLIKSYLEEQWSFIRCQKMKQTFDKVLNQIQDSFVNLADDLLEFIEDEDWENIEEKEFKHVEEQWFSHLHPHIQKVVDYFKFDPDQKASNIKLVKQRLEAEYLRIAPGTPFVLCDNFIKEDKTQWIIEIKQCDSKMVFFNASTIYIGVCRPDIVKRMAFCKVNEGGRGTYLIGSNGWSYHHSDPALDRQDIVGFTFGKGDKIHVQVDLRGRGKIRFRKAGKFFDTKFQMPLNIDQKMLSRPYLKPCVGFSDQVGVTVRIINLSKKDKLVPKQV